MRLFLKLITYPIAILIDCVTWVFVGVLSCSAFIFSMSSSILGFLAFIVLLTGSVTNGLVLLGLAFLISPLGLPMVATWLLGELQKISLAIRGI